MKNEQSINPIRILQILQILSFKLEKTQVRFVILLLPDQPTHPRAPMHDASPGQSIQPRKYEPPFPCQVKIRRGKGQSREVSQHNQMR